MVLLAINTGLSIVQSSSPPGTEVSGTPVPLHSTRPWPVPHFPPTVLSEQMLKTQTLTKISLSPLAYLKIPIPVSFPREDLEKILSSLKAMLKVFGSTPSNEKKAKSRAIHLSEMDR